MAEGRKQVCVNRKARFDYHILETFEAGLVLLGTEVKSLRLGKAHLRDAFGRVEDGELWLEGMHISPYEMGTHGNHEPERTRKLLVSKREVRRLLAKVREKGLTLIPLAVYFKNGWAKVEMALAQGKRQYDKRQAIAERDAARAVARARRGERE